MARNYHHCACRITKNPSRVAVRNLLELDYPELEVIVVNDGSEIERSRKCRRFHCGRSRRVRFGGEECPVRGLYRTMQTQGAGS